MDLFNFGAYLLSKGFTFTNYGTHNLYELENDGVNYCINLQGDKMICNNSEANDLQNDIPTPKNEKEATQWLNDFLGVNETKSKATKK